MKKEKTKKFLIRDIVPPVRHIKVEYASELAKPVFADKYKRRYSSPKIFEKKSSLVGVLAISLILSLISMPLLLAFEAHVINVTATLIMIDPPVITPAGGTYEALIDISMGDADPDATHIFYTVTPGSDPNTALDPVCGVSAGGPKPLTNAILGLNIDSVVKAIACDSGLPGAHESLITTEIYHFTSPFGTILGQKCQDFDQNGDCDGEDFGIEGWRIDLYQDNLLASTTVTGPGGFYVFQGLTPGTYNVWEETRAGWIATSPASTTATLSGGETETVNFHNHDTGYSCVPQDINFPTHLAVQAGGNNDNADDIIFAAQVTVNGDVRSNNDIGISGGGSNRNINGNATSTGDTDEAGIIISGLVLEGAPMAFLPDAGIPFWKSQAEAGGTVNGSFVFPNNTTGLLLGPTEIMGNVTFGSSNSAIVKGPIYIHGNLTIGSNTTITQDPLFLNQFVVIIVDGVINIDSNVAFNGSGSLGTFLLVTTHSAIAGDTGAIETNSNNSDLGDVVLYASNGDIHMNSNRTILAAFAAHGSSTADSAILFDSNVQVNYRTLPTKASCGVRQPFDSTAHVLINEFMPNPVGSDVGVAGGAIDGEWVEIFNPTANAIDVTGYFLYDENNANALPITGTNILGSLNIPAGGFLVVYREGDADFELDNSGGDTARLFSGAIGSGGLLVDSHTYTRDAPENKSFARIPDGSSNWIDPDATPGEPNTAFLEPISDGDPFRPSRKPLLNDNFEVIVIESREERMERAARLAEERRKEAASEEAAEPSESAEAPPEATEPPEPAAEPASPADMPVAPSAEEVITTEALPPKPEEDPQDGGEEATQSEPPPADIPLPEAETPPPPPPEPTPEGRVAE